MLVGACSPKATGPVSPPSSQPNSGSLSRTYYVRGIVRGQIGEDNSVTIEHEDIPGFMPSMTMPFALKDRKEWTGMSVGDAVEFKLTLTDSDSWIEKVNRIDPSKVHLPKSMIAKGATESAERLHEGDSLPSFNLVDQNGRPLTREQLAGKSAVITFIFTRCPIPNFCPLMTKNFGQLQSEITADPTLKGHVQLLSISFDPEHDTPQTLTQYGQAFTRDLDTWRFATGSIEEVNRLTSAFSVYVKAEGGTISHGLCTALVSPEGIVEKIWRGNGWENAEILEALHRKIANR